jgi:hypothetical protein
MDDTINNLNLNEMDLEVKEIEKKKSDKGIFGRCEVTLIPRYGVIHVKNAFNDVGQQQIWNLLKPRISDPSNKGTGFHCVNICHKDHKNRKPVKRVKEVDYYAKLLFERTAEEFMKLNFDSSNEPSYQRLQNLANGSKPFKPGQQFANYYRADASLENHLDSEDILFTMTLSIGDDCEFHIGKPTKRSGSNKRMSERSGKVEKIIMKSGDAVFFDGGSCPHHVVRMVKGTAPSWWNKMKVPNGSRLVVVMREQEESFLKALMLRAKKKESTRKENKTSE